jgi:3-hydroxyisobutyrate dehydrogenase-like beta-hydroxyacid dehydrogenase
MTHSHTPAERSAQATETVAVLGAGGTMGFADRDFAPSFRLTLAAKDASLVRESATQHGLDLPLLDLIARRLHQGAADHGDKDFSATYLTSAPDQAA